MIILLLDVLDSEVLNRFLDDNVIYRPDLLNKSPTHLNRTLASCAVDAIITNRPVPLDALQAWCTVRQSPTYCVRVTIEAGSSDAGSLPTDRDGLPGCIWLDAQGDDIQSVYAAAFEMLEKEAVRRVAQKRDVENTKAAATGRQRSVVLVGAGLLNLITAYRLHHEGYRIHIVDGGPDPRDSAAWTAYGCSRGGDDARMFTLSEMNCRGAGSSNYPDKQIATTMNRQFRKSVAEQGWSVRREHMLSNDEQAWIEVFECLPVWLAHRYNEDIFSFGRESHHLWVRWLETEPELFKSSFFRPGILRVFADEEHLARKIRIQHRIGATTRVFSPSEVAAEHPALGDAVTRGLVVGGIEGIGFTLRAHKFMRHLLDCLQTGGATFSWNQVADTLIFANDGTVTAVLAGGVEISSANFVLSLGAYGERLLEGTQSHGKMHGMLGVWVRLPNVAPRLKQSIKISGTGHSTAAANVAVTENDLGESSLIFGSGYGHTGVDPRNIKPRLLEHMYLRVANTAREYFPAAYREAEKNGAVSPTFKYCVRPWTATGLGIFEIIPTQAGGQCVITGGHNTGGFAQAPSVAEAVLAALEAREHPMHLLYHPRRESAFRAVWEH